MDTEMSNHLSKYCPLSIYPAHFFHTSCLLLLPIKVPNKQTQMVWGSSRAEREAARGLKWAREILLCMYRSSFRTQLGPAKVPWNMSINLGFSTLGIQGDLLSLISEKYIWKFSLHYTPDTQPMYLTSGPYSVSVNNSNKQYKCSEHKHFRKYNHHSELCPRND